MGTPGFSAGPRQRRAVRVRAHEHPSETAGVPVGDSHQYSLGGCRYKAPVAEGNRGVSLGAGADLDFACNPMETGEVQPRQAALRAARQAAREMPRPPPIFQNTEGLPIL